MGDKAFWRDDIGREIARPGKIPAQNMARREEGCFPSLWSGNGWRSGLLLCIQYCKARRTKKGQRIFDENNHFTRRSVDTLRRTSLRPPLVPETSFPQNTPDCCLSEVTIDLINLQRNEYVSLVNDLLEVRYYTSVRRRLLVWCLRHVLPSWGDANLLPKFSDLE